MRQTRWIAAAAACVMLVTPMTVTVQAQDPVEYRVLATRKTSTLEKELNEAAAAGFVFASVMGGETAFGGSESVVVMQKSADVGNRFYRVLAANRTSTMQKELSEAASQGYEYVGQTVFETLFGGNEVVVIAERDPKAEGTRHEYLLVATSKTSTLQKELVEAGGRGFKVVGMTVGRTAMGGAELVAVTRRPAAR